MIPATYMQSGEADFSVDYPRQLPPVVFSGLTDKRSSNVNHKRNQPLPERSTQAGSSTKFTSVPASFHQSHGLSFKLNTNFSNKNLHKPSPVQSKTTKLL